MPTGKGVDERRGRWDPVGGDDTAPEEWKQMNTVTQHHHKISHIKILAKLHTLPQIASVKAVVTWLVLGRILVETIGTCVSTQGASHSLEYKLL